MKLKIIIHDGQLGCFLEANVIHSINRLKEKNHMIVSVNAGKALD